MVPFNQALSQFFGWGSVFCWLIVGFPQFYEMYKLKTGTGLSMLFLAIWGVGDVLGLAGSIMADQLSTQIAVAAWYLIMDMVLIFEAQYYDWLFPEKRKTLLASQIGETVEQGDWARERRPLLKVPDISIARDITFENMAFPDRIAASFETAPRSFIHHTLAVRERAESRGGAYVGSFTSQSHSRIFPGSAANHPTTLHMHSAGLLVLGTLLWACLVTRPLWDGTSSDSIGRVLLSLDNGQTCGYSPATCEWGQIMGWVSSFFYILSRVPQIWKNFTEKSVDGLSIWMFFFGVLGNVTYSASVFAWSMDRDFLVDHLPFLIGSLGTLLFDFVIMLQFFIYKGNSRVSDYQPIE